MTKSTMLHDATPDELIEKISQKLQVQIDQLRAEFANPSTDLMTSKEVCEFLQIDHSTLWAWCKKGKIKKYGIGKRRYFKRGEIIESLVRIEKG